MVESRKPVFHAPSSLAAFPPSSSTAVTSESYVIGLETLPGSYAVSTSSPSADIRLYALSPSGFTHTLSIPIGGNGPSTIRAASDLNGSPILLSSQQHEACVKVWDQRKGTRPMLSFLSPKGHGLLSLDVSPDRFTIAAGTELQAEEASIFYWDPRNSKQPLRDHASTHSDDITAVHFHPARSDALLSVSTDGLLSMSDSLENDEDEAVQAVANWGCSISRAGWVGEDSIWAASDMETFGMWNDNLDLICDFGDVRSPALPGSRWTSDYLIDAFYYSGDYGPFGISGLAIFLGSNSGDIAVVRVVDPHETDPPTWEVRALLRNEETVVRSILWDHPNGLVISGDEAGRLVAWNHRSDPDVEMRDGNAGSFVGGSGTKRGREGAGEDATKRGKFHQ